MATYQQSITALVDGLKTLFENRTCTEAQALANATSKPNTIYYTTDTKCVVVGGQIYGRGQQLSSVFRFCPSGSVPGQDPDFSDPDYIYVVPDGTSFTLYWLNPGGAWSHTTGFQFDIATSASDISYDLTPTPDLGTGDVQSAIEALDGKVEAVDARIDDEKVEFIKERFPGQSIAAYILASQTKVAVSNNNDTISFIGSTATNQTARWSKLLVPKGTLIVWQRQKSQSTAIDCLGYSTVSPQNYYETNGTIVGFTAHKLIWYTATTTYTEHHTIMPEDGYIIQCYLGQDSVMNVSTSYDSSILKDYYNKGFADGSAMASIAGLGYNVYDYISGAVNLAGFEYGCEIRRKYDKTPVASMQNAYKNNTSVVYFPKTDFSGCTSLNGAFYGASKLFIFPSIDVGTKSVTCLQCFRDATSLQYVGDFDGLTITNAEYMFQNCHALRRVGKIKLSASCSAANMFNTTSPNLTRVEELDVTAGCLLNTSSYNWNSGAKTGLRFMLIKGWGTHSSQTTLKVNNSWPVWGIANDEVPDARQSLIDTLITYSFDRATAGYSACTVTLSAATKALLTDEEKEQITAKGYTIA